jgi:hypothetical protein
MRVALNRIILYVRDVDRLATFYRDASGALPLMGSAEIWMVLDARPCQSTQARRCGRA